MSTTSAVAKAASKELVERALKGDKVADEAIRLKIKAFHGSPADFEQFLDEYIGTGEGAQAYGYGHYFAENPEVARWYRDNLASGDLNEAGQKALQEHMEEWANVKVEPWNRLKQIERSQTALQKQLDDLPPFPEPPEGTTSEFDWLFDDPAVSQWQDKYGATSRRLREDLNALESERLDLMKNNPRLAAGDPVEQVKADWLNSTQADNAKFRFLAEADDSLYESGKLYEVDIDADPNDLLDWDKPLSKQTDNVKQALLQIADSNPGLFDKDQTRILQGNPNTAFGTIWGDMSGQDVYKTLSERFNRYPDTDFGDPKSPEAASKLLESVGIRGIKYADATSRKADGGTSNFVVFDPRIVSIAKKYGLTLPLAAKIFTTATATGVALNTPDAEASFVGQMARSFKAQARELAEQMETAGKSRDAIWKATGEEFGAPMMRGADGQWRQEVSDEFMQLKKNPEVEGVAQELADAVQFTTEENGVIAARVQGDQFRTMGAFGDTEEEAFKNLLRNTLKDRNIQVNVFEPGSQMNWLDDIVEGFGAQSDYNLGDVDISSNTREPSYRGAYFPDSDTIDIRYHNPMGTGPRTDEDMLGTIAHELQHAIQEREGFARGGNTESMERVIERARMDLRYAEEEFANAKEGFELTLKNRGYDNFQDLSRTAYQMNEIDRLKGYLSTYYQGGKLTDKRRNIFNSAGSIMDPNDEYRMRMDINWSKRHRPQAERDAQYAQYIENAIKYAEERLDPTLVEQVQTSGVKNPYAKYQRELNKARSAAQESFGVEMNDARLRVNDLNNFLSRYEYSGGSGLYTDLAGEVEARTVQERLRMSMQDRIDNPPWTGKEWGRTPEYQQVVVDEYGMPSNVRGLSNQRSASRQVNAEMPSWIDEIEGMANIDENGMMTVYHRTTPEQAEQIRKTGVFTPKEDGIFFSTSPRGQAEGYGTEVVEMKIPANELQLDDLFDDEAHLRLPAKANKPNNIGRYLAGGAAITATGAASANSYGVLQSDQRQVAETPWKDEQPKTAAAMLQESADAFDQSMTDPEWFDVNEYQSQYSDTPGKFARNLVDVWGEMGRGMLTGLTGTFGDLETLLVGGLIPGIVGAAEGEGFVDSAVTGLATYDSVMPTAEDMRQYIPSPPKIGNLPAEDFQTVLEIGEMIAPEPGQPLGIMKSAIPPKFGPQMLLRPAQ